MQAIAEAARELVRLRDDWLNPADGTSGVNLKERTLTNLYNKRPDWLDLAHKRLDAAVFDAYGWPHDLSDDEILARLLALNLERAAGQGAVPVRWWGVGRIMIRNKIGAGSRGSRRLTHASGQRARPGGPQGPAYQATPDKSGFGVRAGPVHGAVCRRRMKSMS